MALADIPTGGQRRRLDSWKEIAEYLGRDVRTATRWEAQGLPLHRVPGGRGTSVFAFSDEIDLWMAGGRHMAAMPDAEPARAEAASAAPPAVATPNLRRLSTFAASALILASASVTWLYVQPGALDVATLHATATATEVTLSDAGGRIRVLHRFAPGAVLVARTPARLEDVDEDGTSEVVVAVADYESASTRTVDHGELLNLSGGGAIRWRFGFDDVVTFGAGPLAGPWAFADWQVDDASPRRIAVAAHDYTWWAGIVAVLRADGTRLGHFVNPGWMESVLWVEGNRLAVGGFNNQRDEAMFALLDGRDISGQAPGSAGTPFACLSCSNGPPLFYATFARSELNKVTASRFNRAQVTTVDGSIVVTTSETGADRSEVNAIYEFDRDLRLVKARYSDRYWDEHRRLELDGLIEHARDRCPDRDGPRAIHVWAGGGWQRIAAPR